MSELTKLLRFQGHARNEFAITPIQVSGESPLLFESQLTSGYSRIGCYVYNNSASASGECYWGGASVSDSTGFPIPRGSVVEIPLVVDLDFYLVSESGEIGDLRVLEIA